MPIPAFRLILAFALPVALAGCDLLGIEPASAIAARKEAEGKAIGGACRHAGRGIEDCYHLNKRSDKAAVFTGWREMNDYMRENKIETMAPHEDAASGPDKAADEHGAPPSDGKPAGKAKGEPSDGGSAKRDKADVGAKSNRRDDDADSQKAEGSGKSNRSAAAGAKKPPQAH